MSKNRNASALLSMLLAALFAALFTGCISKPTSDSLIIQRTAYYETDAQVRDKIRDECGLEERVPKYIRAYARGDYDSIFLTDRMSDSTPSKVLVMKIVNAKGLGGGRYSGPKSLTIEGTLSQDGKVLGSFIAHRASMGGYHGRHLGTCGILNKCAKRIGKDVGPWLAKPTMDAVLGTAKPRQKVIEPAEGSVEQ